MKAQQSGRLTARYCWTLLPAAAGAAEELLELPLALPPVPLAAPLGNGAACSGLSTGVAAGAGRVADGMVDSPASGSDVTGAAIRVVGAPSISGDCAAGSGCSIGSPAGICVSLALMGGRTG